MTLRIRSTAGWLLRLYFLRLALTLTPFTWSASISILTVRPLTGEEIVTLCFLNPINENDSLVHPLWYGTEKRPRLSVIVPTPVPSYHTLTYASGSRLLATVTTPLTEATG